MSEVFAITDLYDQVVQRFTDEASEEAPAPAFEFGWRKPAEFVGAPRIVFVPGDDEEAGELVAPTTAGTEPRNLAMLNELVTIYVVAEDVTDHTNERKQYEACRLLFDLLVRALYLAATGTYRTRSVRWVKPDATLRAGAAMRMVLAVEAPIPDLLLTFVTPLVAHVENRLGETEDTDDDIPEPPAP